MKDGHYSRTAEAAAALRANHYLNASSPVFSDPYALAMAGNSWKNLLDFPVIPRLMNSPMMNHTLGRLTAQVVARSRFSEDQLINSIHKGMSQYVLVGAGLDSFALRLAAHYPNLDIFELDHPDTQAAKIARLKSFGEIPQNVHFVPIDFEKEKIFDALKNSEYQLEKPAFFSWLGTTHYLMPETTLSSLENIAQYAIAGSELCMDYSIAYQQLKGIEKLGVYAVGQFTHFLKEPLIGAFKSEVLHEKLHAMGYQILEDLSGHDITKKYFLGRKDHIKHTNATHLLHIQLMNT